MSKQDIELAFLKPNHEKDGQMKYFNNIGEVIKKYRGSRFELKSSANKYKFRVGSFEDTSLSQYPDMLEEWEQFYLPDEMKMKVFGVLENFPCNSDAAELLLMVCEDGKVFGYEDQNLHVVANSLGELFESGLKFPGTEQFYRGQSFEKMTGDDWDELKKASNMMKEHQELLKEEEQSYICGLNTIMQGLHPHVPAQMGGAAKEVDPVAVI